MTNSLLRFTTRTTVVGAGVLALTSATAVAIASTNTPLLANTSMAASPSAHVIAKPIALTPVNDSASFQQQFSLGKHPVTLTVSETEGLTIQQGDQRSARQNGSFISAGAHLITPENTEFNEPYIQALVFDIDRQEIRGFTIQLEEDNIEHKNSGVSIVETTSTKVNGAEAMCSNLFDDQIHIVNIDAIGMLNHYVAIAQKTSQALDVYHLRTFAIGPGIKSCALTSNSHGEYGEHTLYLADEYAGVWTMPANEEAEIERNLLFAGANTPIEGISTDGGITAWVSPTKSGIWLSSECATEYASFAVDIAPEIVNISVHDEMINITVYDDDSGKIFTGEHAVKNACENAQTQAEVNKTPITKPSVITASYETDIVNSYGDAADDPAIWVNGHSPSNSLVIGTNKKGSLNTYNLQGKLVERHEVGRVNNVGVAYNWGVENNDIAVASNRSNNSLSVFFIDKQNGKLTFNTHLPTPLVDIYGLCVFSLNGHAEVLVNSTDGRYLHYRLHQTTTNTGSEPQVTASLLHDFSLPSQPEGCVVDTASNTAFLGEEGAGIWALDISSPTHTPTRIIDLNAPVAGDIEGLALFDVDGERYLIASSQGNNQYAIYKSDAPYTLMGMIKIEANYADGIDGVSETDGLEATNQNLAGAFSRGLFVVQDGRNILPTERQNFKLVSGTALENAIREQLRIVK